MKAFVYVGIGLLYLVIILMVIRNNWVYKQRINALLKDAASYVRLPSYDYMLLHFWIWDVKKFLRGEAAP